MRKRRFIRGWASPILLLCLAATPCDEDSDDHVPPSIDILRPACGTIVDDDQVRIEGLAGPGTLPIQVGRYQVNGQDPREFSGWLDETFSFVALGLEPGFNTIRLEVEDELGSSAHDTIDVLRTTSDELYYLELVPSLVAIPSEPPEDGRIFLEATVWVLGDDDQPFSLSFENLPDNLVLQEARRAIDINGQRVYSITLEQVGAVPEGTHEAILRADGSTFTASTSLDVFVDVPGAHLDIIRPRNGTMTTADTIEAVVSIASSEMVCTSVDYRVNQGAWAGAFSPTGFDVPLSSGTNTIEVSDDCFGTHTVGDSVVVLREEATVAPNYDIGISRFSVDPSTAAVGDTVIYTLQVQKNPSNVADSGIQVGFRLPDALTLDSVLPPESADEYDATEGVWSFTMSGVYHGIQILAVPQSVGIYGTNATITGGLGANDSLDNNSESVTLTIE